MEIAVWLLVVGFRLWVVGFWLLVFGCWLWVLLFIYKTNNPQPTTHNQKQKNEGQKQTHSALRFLSYLELLKEIITLVIHKNEGREILYADFPYSLHTELWIFHAFDALDIAG